FSFTNSTRCCSYLRSTGRSSGGTAIQAALSSALQNSGAGSAASSGASEADPASTSLREFGSPSVAGRASSAGAAPSVSIRAPAASAPSSASEGVISFSRSIAILLCSAALSQPRVEVVAVDQGLEPALQFRGDARPPVRFLARFAFLDAAVADRLHLGLDEGV